MYIENWAIFEPYVLYHYYFEFIVEFTNKFIER